MAQQIDYIMIKRWWWGTGSNIRWRSRRSPRSCARQRPARGNDKQDYKGARGKSFGGVADDISVVAEDIIVVAEEISEGEHRDRSMTETSH